MRKRAWQQAQRENKPRRPIQKLALSKCIFESRLAPLRNKALSKLLTMGIKIVMVGSGGVGKSALALRFVKSEFGTALPYNRLVVHEARSS